MTHKHTLLLDQRVSHELDHGKKLANEGAEHVWNWTSPGGQKRAKRRAHSFVEMGRITQSDAVLEVGCGTGLFTRKVHEATRAKIIAIDISTDLLDLARDANSSPDISYVIEDAMNMKFQDGQFDVVFGSSILHHLDFERSLKEIFRVLKKGGSIAFAEPNMLNPQILIQKNIPFIKKHLGDSPDETAVIRWQLAKLMKKIGFTNVRIIPHDFLHPFTPVFLIPLVDKFGRFLEKIPGIREIAGSVMIVAEKPTNRFAVRGQDSEKHFDAIAQEYDYWKEKNRYYYHSLIQLYRSLIPPKSSVMEIGCGTGTIIAQLDPRDGKGIDISAEMIAIARKKHARSSHIRYEREDISESTQPFQFRYVFLADVLEHVDPVSRFIEILARRTSVKTHVIISVANPIWESVLMIAEKFHMKMPEGPHKRLSIRETETLFVRSGFTILERGYRLLIPKKIPGSDWINARFYKNCLLRKFGFTVYWILRH